MYPGYKAFENYREREEERRREAEQFEADWHEKWCQRNEDEEAAAAKLEEKIHERFCQQREDEEEQARVMKAYEDDWHEQWCQRHEYEEAAAALLEDQIHERFCQQQDEEAERQEAAEAYENELHEMWCQRQEEEEEFMVSLDADMQEQWGQANEAEETAEENVNEALDSLRVLECPKEGLHDQDGDQQHDMRAAALGLLPPNVQLLIAQKLGSARDARSLAAVNRRLHTLVVDNISSLDVNRPVATAVCFAQALRPVQCMGFNSGKSEIKLSASLAGMQDRLPGYRSDDVVIRRYEDALHPTRWVQFENCCDIYFDKCAFSDDALRSIAALISGTAANHKELKSVDGNKPISLMFNDCDFHKVSPGGFKAFVDIVAPCITNFLLDAGRTSSRQLTGLLLRSDASFHLIPNFRFRCSGKTGASSSLTTDLASAMALKMLQQNTKCGFLGMIGQEIPIRTVLHLYHKLFGCAADVPLVYQFSVEYVSEDEYTAIWEPKVRAIEQRHSIGTSATGAEDGPRHRFSYRRSENGGGTVTMGVNLREERRNLRNFASFDYLRHYDNYDEPICPKDAAIGDEWDSD